MANRNGCPTKAVFVMRDTFNDNEIVCRGDAVECAKAAETSADNIRSAFKRCGLCKKRYSLEYVGEMPRKAYTPSPDRPTAKDLRMKRIVPSDIIRIRRSTLLGTLVRCYRYDESASFTRRYVGNFPIVEKHRYIFTVQMKGFMESYSWTDLIRKDGVEIVSEDS